MGWKEGDVILNERRFQIFHELISGDGKYSINKMAQKFNVTERTIRYDIEEINLFFTNKGFSVFLGVENGFITIISDIHEKSEIINLIDNIGLDFREYILSPRERKYIILMELFFAEDFITINYLADKLKVCRNTIINDLDKVKCWLIENKIEPIFIPSKGLGIEGEEKVIRKAILEVFREALPIEQYMSLIEYNLYHHPNLRSYSSRLFDYLSNNINIKEVRNCIDTIQRKLDIMFSDLVYIEIIICLSINIWRIKLNSNMYISDEEKQEISSTKVYREVESIAEKISRQFNINFTIDETIYFSQFILASNTITIPVIEDFLNLWESKSFTASLIVEVGKRLKNDFTKDKKLYDELFIFFQPFMYRQKYNIPIYNPYLKEIQANYPKTFTAVKSSILHLDPNIGNTINDDEIGYISLYFAAYLEIQNEFDVLIVSGTGFSTANLLSTKLKSLFNINIVALVSINEIPNILEKNKVDLIVSTSNFIDRNIDTDIPCIVVNPLLTEEDILLFKQYLRERKTKNIERVKIL